MWQRFTERSRRVVFFAQEEAGRWGENHVATEHLLLGLVRENDSVAARVLDRIGVSLGRIRSEVERQVTRGERRLGQDMQLAPKAKRVIDLAYDEARRLNNNYIGSEHLLLGLIREEEGLAGRVLNKLGVDLERTRREVVQLQDEVRPLQEQVVQLPDMQERQDAQSPNYQSFVERVQDVVKRLFTLNPKLAQLSDAELVRTLTGETMDQIQTAKAAGSDAENVKTQPGIGDLGVLRYADGERAVETAVDEHSLLELVAILRARDYYGYRGLVADGRVCLLPSGTGAKILHPAHLDLHRAVSQAVKEVSGRYVRILDGDQEGQTAWIVPEAFHCTGPDTTPFPPLISDVEQDCDTE